MKINALAVAVLGVAGAALCQTQLKPDAYPLTIEITTSRVDDVVVGSTSKTTTELQHPGLPAGVFNKPQTKTTQTDKTKKVYTVVGVIDGTQYTLQSQPGALLGTYKARMTNNQYIDILIVEPGGRSHNVGTKIVAAEKVKAEMPTAPAATKPQ